MERLYPIQADYQESKPNRREQNIKYIEFIKFMTDPLHPWSWSPGKSLSLVTFSKPISMHTTRQIPEKIFCKWLWARWHPNPNSSQTIAGKVRLICTNRSFKQRQQKDRVLHTGKCRNPSIQIVRFRMYTSAWLNLFKTGAHFHLTFKRNERFNGLNCAVPVSYTHLTLPTKRIV